MRTFFPKPAPEKLSALIDWSKLRQEQLTEAVSVTKDTVTEFLMRQIERGNWKEVQEVLHGKPMTKAGKFLLEELRDSVVSKLIFRLGLRKVIAVGLAVVLLPLVFAKVAGQLMSKVRQ
ncbi:hypothetical protein [Pontibacter pamirensis]|uniref:hypothetical protein n=1 Tax=Pontibacter pamirensis TaxID=2562824 RepID=UPI001F28C37E|nr:hypothetical protein [Pontibacter pamirensis]